MSLAGLDSKFQTILDSNVELVAEYNSIDSNIPLEYAFEDIVDVFNT